MVTIEEDPTHCPQYGSPLEVITYHDGAALAMNHLYHDDCTSSFLGIKEK
jgi:hypothetical protein